MRERPAFYGILSGHHDRQIVAKIEHLLAQLRVQLAQQLKPQPPANEEGRP